MRGKHLLTDRQCERAKPRTTGAYLLPDGGSLYLRVRPSGGRAWTYRYRDRKERGGKVREMGLGSYPEVTLAGARRKVEELRKQHKAGVDLLGAKKAEEVRQRGIPTFAEAIQDYLAWRTDLVGSSRVEWETTLRLHAAKLHPIRVDVVQPEDVHDALKEVWAKNSSARRILNRVEQIFERCVALRYCQGNPARWSIQQHLLGLPSKAGDGHKAMPWQQIPEFMERLRAQPGQMARTLEFIILTAARAGEVIGDDRRSDTSSMALSEISDAIWTVPGSRMKRGKEHKVPLSQRALEIAPEVAGTRRLTNTSFRPLLKKLGADCTVHGFRTTFSTWANENGWGSDPGLVEFALSHGLPSKTEAAYMRVTRVNERRELMDKWARFCAGEDTSAEIVWKLRA